MKEKIIKIVYFDENSAIDYINIVDGGKAEKETTTSKKNESGGRISIGSKIASSLKFLNIFNAEAGIESSAELVSQSKDIVKSTITNTILTDFILKVNDDKTMIEKFDNINITILKDSFTYLKLFTPYTYIISETSDINKDIAVNKLDDIMEKIKGYYEVLADIDDRKYVLRFNINCFRNNYKLTDLLKMDLNYYGIKVGKILTKKLTSDNELDITDNIQEVNAESIVNKVLGNDQVLIKDEEREIYDIVLAGVKYNDGE